jgi:phosphatidylglycerophosphatase A
LPSSLRDDAPPSAVETLAAAIATGFGSGLSPFAPGTAGTLVAVPLAYLLTVSMAAGVAAQTAALVAITAVAVWSAGMAAPRFGRKDPGQIVVDEIAGYLVAVAFLPPGWITLAAAFVLFRLFDVVKPPPCRRAEALPGGWGIVADDLLAGLYANLGLRLLCFWGILSP